MPEVYVECSKCEQFVVVAELEPGDQIPSVKCAACKEQDGDDDDG